MNNGRSIVSTMPPKGKSKIPGFVPGMTRTEYHRIYMRNRRGPPKERPQIAGIEPGMNRAEKMKVYRRKYAKSEKGQIVAANCQARHEEKHHEKLIEQARLHKEIEKVVNQGEKAHTDFTRHLEETFEDWMNWKNYGVYRINGPRKWQLGHRIPRCVYAEHSIDVARCFSFDNLFAQDAEENAKDHSTDVSPYMLMNYAHILPVAWV